MFDKDESIIMAYYISFVDKLNSWWVSHGAYYLLKIENIFKYKWWCIVIYYIWFEFIEIKFKKVTEGNVSHIEDLARVKGVTIVKNQTQENESKMQL